LDFIGNEQLNLQMSRRFASGKPARAAACTRTSTTNKKVQRSLLRDFVCKPRRAMPGRAWLRALTWAMLLLLTAVFAIQCAWTPVDDRLFLGWVLGFVGAAWLAVAAGMSGSFLYRRHWCRTCRRCVWPDVAWHGCYGCFRKTCALIADYRQRR
jgi:hypothetical protein